MRCAAARGIDPAYLSRLLHGIKTRPSEETLRKLGLRREERYAPR